jgi:DNA-binding response OmpR family regulator
MVVDDEPSITRMLKRNLEETGNYEVLGINDASLAIPKAREFKPDLILLDVMMPNLSGDVLASQIQAHPELQHVPIVFLTALATPGEVSAHHGLIGGLPFLAKPVDLRSVIGCIDRHLSCSPA